MTASQDIIRELTDNLLERRAMRRRTMMKATSLAAAGLAAGGIAGTDRANAAVYTLGDADVLNFALNLEFLEANYYLLGVTGQALPAALTGGGPAPLTPSTTLVPFETTQLAYYFQRIAADEYAHVGFLRTAIGATAITQPQIDLNAAFTTLAVAAGLVPAGKTFNPFANEIGFLVGAYIFEDVGVTAYGGGAAYLQNADNLSYAASILAIEGYHAGAIRGYLATRGGSAVTNAISNLRAALSGKADDNGTSLAANGGNPYNIVNADINAQSFRRSFNQVLNIVYGGASAGGGLFFPMGMNGTVRVSTDVFNPYTNITI